jgi:hypothetical protein
LLVLPAFQDCQENNGLGDMMDEDVMNNVAVRVKLSLTVWDFTLPLTPSLPAVIGVSWQYSVLVCSVVLVSYDTRITPNAFFVV